MIKWRRAFATVGLLLIGVVLIQQTRLLYLKSHLEPTSNEIALARVAATESIPLINEFKKKHGTYPCHLSEVMGGKSDLLEKVARYQATPEGFYLYVQNPGGTPVIFWNRDGIEARWEPCTPYASCPPGTFSQNCCGQEKYPKCEIFSNKLGDP